LALININDREVPSMKIVNQESVPSLIYCLKHLTKLEIVNTSFTDIEQGFPDEIKFFASSLIDLYIQDTKIINLSNDISKLKRLQTLKLSNTGLTSLPDSIGDLPLLNFLQLPYNNLSSLPLSITKLRSLQQLTLSNNPYLRSVQSLNGHPSLRILDTKNCPIELIPRNLPQLTTLYMSNNNLRKLIDIETLGKATDSKKMFDFDQNRIETVSPRIGHVRNLYRLNLCCNKLKVLPKNILNIATLSYLNIKCNPFPPRDLKEMVSKFRTTNPKLKLSYK
jgi:Leucine-rich repeat (LRR) protein